MLVPSKKIFYALEAVLYIAYNAKEQAVAGGELAEAQKLPPRYLEPMLQKLVRAGVLRGVRGPQGGYMLGRERRRITLADISSALSESKDLPESATPLGTQVLLPNARRLMAVWREQMGEVNLHQLCEEAVKAAIPTTHEPTHDFII